jgi:hypothetical protein
MTFWCGHLWLIVEVIFQWNLALPSRMTMARHPTNCTGRQPDLCERSKPVALLVARLNILQECDAIERSRMDAEPSDAARISNQGVPTENRVWLTTAPAAPALTMLHTLFWAGGITGITIHSDQESANELHSRPFLACPEMYDFDCRRF